MIHAVIDICCTIFASKSKFTFASVMCKMINTFSAILAWAKFRSGAIRNFGLAVFSRISIGTLALVRSNFINTRGIVLATIAKTMPRVLIKLDLTNANVPMDILENTAKPKFLIAPLLNLAHAKMAENVLIILHITLANVNLDLLAKIVQQISMTAW